MKVIDLRDNEKWEIGNMIEMEGDGSLLCATTDKGYRLVIDTSNIKQIVDYYVSKQVKK